MFGAEAQNPVVRLRVKICGLTTPEDAEAAIAFGADALGFNFFPGSKRYLPAESAAGWIAKLPDEIAKVAILVNPSLAEAKATAAMPGITALQLHGNETPEFCQTLMEAGIRFAKALPVVGAASLDEAASFFTSTLVLDSAHEGEFGGSGRTLPWEIARDFVEANPHLRVILAGGLTPENVGAAADAVRPYGVDVTSGVEASPGHKDHERLRAFLAAAKAR
jgi:phosphoribosylanthranilate isomerase